MSCITTEDICVIRGDNFGLSVGLSQSFKEVVEDPASFEGQLVFRTDQNDGVSPYLTLTATPELIPDYTPDCYRRPGDPVVYMHFKADPDETQSLPEYDIVAYCELRQGASLVSRLFNANVDMHD